MLQYASISKTGDRTTNEDCAGAAAFGSDYCFAVADGLGGHCGGDVASGVTVKNALSLFQSHGCNRSFIDTAFSQAQEILLSLQKKENNADAYKTTLVLLTVTDKLVQWGHIGDTRLYMFSNNKLLLRTQDHSVTQSLVDSGELKEKDLRNHPAKNRLLKVLGSSYENGKYDLSPLISPEPGQAFLLCTDGFWTLIHEKQMLRALKHAQTPQQWLEAMSATIEKNGKEIKMDNYTALAVFIRQAQ